MLIIQKVTLRKLTLPAVLFQMIFAVSSVPVASAGESASLGISTEAEASAADVAALIDQIRNQNIRAVFLENLSNKKLIVQIAMEADVCVDGTLYADSLSEPEGPASTYIAMMRHNARAIAQALGEDASH